MPDAIDEIHIGMGATVSAGADCYPATVVHVEGRTVSIQMDRYTPAEGYDFYSNQVHDFHADPEGEIKVFSLRADGRYSEVGQSRGSGYRLSLGERRQYSSPDV